jgi:BASS family bile acid:Na+ symporter
VTRLLLAFLAQLSRWARIALPAGIAVGLVAQPLAAALRPAVPYCVIILLVHSMVHVAWPALRASLRRPVALGLVTVWTLLLTPLAVGVIGHSVGVPAELLSVLILGAAAPPLMSGAALAMMLGLDGALALTLIVIGTLLAPITLPLVAELTAVGMIGSSAATLLFRGAAIIGGCYLAAFAIRRAVGAQTIGKHAASFEGFGVALMIVFAIGIMDGVARLFSEDPVYVLRFIAAAFVLNILLQLSTGLAFARFGRAAVTIGFVAGYRNAGLLLALLPAPIDQAVTVFVAAAQFPIYILPSLLWPLYARAKERP